MGSAQTSGFCINLSGTGAPTRVGVLPVHTCVPCLGTGTGSKRGEAELSQAPQLAPFLTPHGTDLGGPSWLVLQGGWARAGSRWRAARRLGGRGPVRRRRRCRPQSPGGARRPSTHLPGLKTEAQDAAGSPCWLAGGPARRGHPAPPRRVPAPRSRQRHAGSRGRPSPPPPLPRLPPLWG